MELIVELIVEILLYTIGDWLVTLGFESIAHSFKRQKDASKYLALIGCVFIGSLLGIISYFIYPYRIVSTSSFSGISLIVSPLIVGLIMKKIGVHRIKTNKPISVLATFEGGTLFAFSMSLLRFLLVN